jgi:hypothetical protein
MRQLKTCMSLHTPRAELGGESDLSGAADRWNDARRIPGLGDDESVYLSLFGLLHVPDTAWTKAREWIALPRSRCDVCSRTEGPDAL